MHDVALLAFFCPNCRALCIFINRKAKDTLSTHTQNSINFFYRSHWMKNMFKNVCMYDKIKRIIAICYIFDILVTKSMNNRSKLRIWKILGSGIMLKLLFQIVIVRSKLQHTIRMNIHFLFI